MVPAPVYPSPHVVLRPMEDAAHYSVVGVADDAPLGGREHGKRESAGGKVPGYPDYSGPFQAPATDRAEPPVPGYDPSSTVRTDRGRSQELKIVTC